MGRVAEQSGVTFVNEAQMFNWSGDDFMDGMHFSPAGNGRFAEILTPYTLQFIGDTSALGISPE